MMEVKGMTGHQVGHGDGEAQGADRRVCGRNGRRWFASPSALMKRWASSTPRSDAVLKQGHPVALQSLKGGSVPAQQVLGPQPVAELHRSFTAPGDSKQKNRCLKEDIPAADRPISLGAAAAIPFFNDLRRHSNRTMTPLRRAEAAWRGRCAQPYDPDAS